MIFHRHRWDVVGTSFTPPNGEMHVKGRGPEAAHLCNVALVGLTTISLRCTECGDVKVREVYGKWQEGARTPLTPIRSPPRNRYKPTCSKCERRWTGPAKGSGNADEKTSHA